MLSLPTVTISVLATQDHKAAAYALRRSCEQVSFRNAIIMTDKAEWFEGLGEITVCPAFGNSFEICQWLFRDAQRHLVPRIGSHALGIHWDGFVINPDAWTDEFLNYDYMGGLMWGNTNGNGGFTLYSKAFFSALAAMRITPCVENCHPSDQKISTLYRSVLERMGVKFAPNHLCQKFSVENGPYNGSFGFHGILSLAEIVRKGLY